jgi:hypothetical protein
MLRKKWVLGIVGAGLLVVGMAAGVAMASNFNAFAGSYTPMATATTTPNAYCQLYLNTVAGKLGKQVSDLTSANQAGMQAVIDQMAKDGKITADQKTQLEQKLQNAASNPCALLGALRFGRGAKGGGALGGALSTARSTVEQKVADALKISVSTLESDLKSGQTVQQIATSQKADYNSVKTAYLNAVQDQLNAAVGNKTITQPQSTAIFAKIQQAVNNNQFPLLERGGHGMKGAPATPSASSGSN